MKKIIIYFTIVFIGIHSNYGQAFSTPPTVTKEISTSSKVSKTEKIYKIEQSNVEQEIVLNEQDVLLSGSDNKIHIKGTVANITITGKNNEVDLESVNSILLSSDFNFVSWQTSTNKSGKPIVTDKGGYNNVGKKSANSLQKGEN